MHEKQGSLEIGAAQHSSRFVVASYFAGFRFVCVCQAGCSFVRNCRPMRPSGFAASGGGRKVEKDGNYCSSRCGFVRSRAGRRCPQRRPALKRACSAGSAWYCSVHGFLAWGLSSLCALFPPGEPELLPAPSPSSPTRIPLRITSPYRSFDSPYTLLLYATNRQSSRPMAAFANISFIEG